MLPQAFWRQLEGTILDDRVRVGKLIRAEHDGLFEAEPLEGAQVDGAHALAVRFIDNTTEPVLERYLEASFLIHPNLLPCFAAGKFDFAGTHFVYSVLERADATLSDAISEHP